MKLAALLSAVRCVSDGVACILIERQRQINAEGWTPEHDDQHTRGELAAAAVCYANYAAHQVEWPDAPRLTREHYTTAPGKLWPWDSEWLKLSPDPIRNLEKAGALIAAEIDRLKRKEANSA